MSQTAVVVLAVRTCICKDYLEVLGEDFECNRLKLAALVFLFLICISIVCKRILAESPSHFVGTLCGCIRASCLCAMHDFVLYHLWQAAQQSYKALEGHAPCRVEVSLNSLNLSAQEQSYINEVWPDIDCPDQVLVFKGEVACVIEHVGS